jgi:subtilisin family serine protease
LISDIISEREAVAAVVADDLRNNENAARLYRINWGQLLADSTSVEALTRNIDEILRFASGPPCGNILFVDDASSFSSSNPLFGEIVANRFYDAISHSKLRVLTAATKNEFAAEISADPLLRPIFEKIEINTEDDFVGDKLSPDLREMVNSGNPDGVVKVILQAEDINSRALRQALAANGVTIDSSAANLNMMVLDLPVKAAESVASAQGAKHLSLDRKMAVLGHIETTTGASLVRTIQQGLDVGLLGTTVVNSSSELDGTGIGIAILDSGIREDHRSFVDASGRNRIVQHNSFAAQNNPAQDLFGHGTHVASLAAGSDGANLNLGDGLYISNYEGIAPGAKIINLRFLGDDGLGSSASLINALNWILTNRAANNIRIVNLSLGTPVVESWRTDPLCRAVRQLTAAGIVVVAAAGNNGKTPDGQKIYGAIHSPGNDPSVITVGAANTFGTDGRDDDGITTYSSRGPTRSYWTDANGVKHFDNLIKPDLVAPGNLIVALELEGTR